MQEAKKEYLWVMNERALLTTRKVEVEDEKDDTNHEDDSVKPFTDM